MSTGLIVTLVVVAVLVIWVISIYNNLVALRNNRENAFANIDVQLKQSVFSCKICNSNFRTSFIF